MSANTYTKTSKETFLVRDEEITVKSEFRYDAASHQKISDETLDNQAIQKAFAIYREKHNIPTADTIVAARDNSLLAKSEVAHLIGIDVDTYIRYEAGVLPTIEHGVLLANFVKNIER